MWWYCRRQKPVSYILVFLGISHFRFKLVYLRPYSFSTAFISICKFFCGGPWSPSSWIHTAHRQMIIMKHHVFSSMKQIYVFKQTNGRKAIKYVTVKILSRYIECIIFAGILSISQWLNQFKINFNKEQDIVSIRARIWLRMDHIMEILFVTNILWYWYWFLSTYRREISGEWKHVYMTN